MKPTFVIFVAALLAACSPKVDERGYIANEDWKSAIVVGQTTKQEVLDKFGSPSAQSSFGSENWYYISSKKETVAFLKPEIAEQNVTDIEFDSGGVVTALNFYGNDDARKIDIVKRTTPTEGHQMSFIEQTLGNIGRFNKPGGMGSGTSNRHGQR